MFILINYIRSINKYLSIPDIMMISKAVESINEIIEQLRLDKIDGAIEILFDDHGAARKLIIRKKSDERPNSEIEDAIQKIRIQEPDLSHLDASDMKIIESNLAAFDLHESNFSGAVIQSSNFSYSYLNNASFYNTKISQSNFSNAYKMNPVGANLTGSVNLYNVNTGVSGEWPGAYGQFATINNPHPNSGPPSEEW
jgi:hypothetical protein